MMKTKVLSMVLACLMIFSVAPTHAFAEEAAVHTCPGKGNAHTLANAVDPVAHPEGNVAATCTQPGGIAYKCSHCDTVFFGEFIKALGHDFVTTDAEAPTCTEDGKTAGKDCTRCDEEDVVVKVDPATGHAAVVDAAVAPTCTATGLTAGSHCGVCGVTLVEQAVVPMIDHAWEFVSVSAPEAGKKSEVTYKCHCGATKTVTVECTNHNDDIVLPAVAATCTTTGLTEGKQCSVCGEVLVKQEVTPIIPHTAVVDAAVAPTCTATGLTEGSHCGVCGETLVAQEVVEALGHTEVEIPAVVGSCKDKTSSFTAGTKCGVCGEVLVAPVDQGIPHNFKLVDSLAPTCTEAGYKTWKCNNFGCNDFDYQEILPATGHEWGETPVEVKAPTCTEAGYEVYECACGEKDTRVLEATGHKIVTNEVAPTCKLEGYKYDACDVCDYESEKYDITAIDPKNHVDYEDETVNEATCTSEGQVLRKCNDCGVVEIVVIEKKAHDYAWSVETAATCVATGVEKGVCNDCGATTTKEIAATGIHNSDKVLAAVAPTCTATGLTEGAACSVCGKVMVAQEVVEALGHTAVVDAAVAPTCTETGLTEGSHCGVCGEVLVAQEVVAAKGHNSDTVLPAVAPTCTTTGLTEGAACSVCGKVMVAQETVAIPDASNFNEFQSFESVEAAGHKIVEDSLSAFVPKTCTTDGYSIYACEHCGKNVVIIDKAAHLDVVVDAAVAPTCTATGLTEGSHCGVCGEVIVAQTEVEALGHDIEVLAAVAPTCTETGLTEGKNCTRCDEADVAQEVVEALGHTAVVDAAVAPTCTTTGLTEGSHCGVCGETLVAQEVVEALGHKTVTTVKAATCTGAGFTTDTCEVCDYEYVYAYVAPLGHDIEVLEAVAPTCITTGLTEGKNCTRCDDVDVAQEVVPMLAHKNAAGDYLEDSCKNKIEDRHCVNGCDADIAATHPEYIEVHVDPTCVEEGYNIVYCPDCGDVASKKVTDVATGHHYDYEGKPVEVVPATCEKAGVAYYKCNDCDERDAVEIPALGHDFADELSYDETNHWYACSRCDVVDAKANHVYGEPVVVAPTISTPGTQTYTCDCGYVHVVTTYLEDPAVGFTFDINNDLEVAGKTFVNSSLVAVTVNMKGYNGAVANGIAFNVVYDKTAVEFEGYEFVNANFDGDRYAWMGINGVVDHNGYVSVAANLADYTADAAISAEGEALVVIYFRVNTKTHAATEFSFSDIKVNVADAEADLVETEGVASAITFSRFLDANGDGYVDMRDFNITANLVDTDGYLVNVDVNKDGVIDIENDLAAIFGFLAAANEDELLAKRPA